MSHHTPARHARSRSLRVRPVLAALTAATLLAVGLSAGSPAEAAVTQSASCLDGGGVRWTSKAVWGSTYVAADRVRRVTMDYAGWTTSKAGYVATDSSVRTYDGYGKQLQQLQWTGRFDYRAGTAYKVRNPLNPPSSPGRAKVTVSLGVDGDGLSDCTVTFTEPGSAPTPSTPAPSTPAPSTPAPSTPAPSTPAPSIPAPSTPAPSIPAPSTPAPSTTGPTDPSDVYEADVLTATNAERTSRGLVALTAQACVDSYAEAQSAKMAAENRMYHQDLGPILSACRLMAVGENVAYGYPDGTAVTAAWMASTGHRANLLNTRYRLLGVGATRDAQGRWYVAQVFGSTS